MAVDIPESAVLQPGETEEMSESGVRTLTRTWFDKYDRLQTLARGIRVGDPFDESGSLIVLSSSLQQTDGGALLSLRLAVVDEDDADNDNEDVIKKETWSLKSLRNDVSILAYCGSGENQPNREWIECWQKEPDAEVAAGNTYTKPDGTVASFEETDHEAATADLIAKIRRGVESVMRFYPQLTCRRILSKAPKKMLDELGFISDPFDPSDVATKPGNLSTIVGAHQWVMIQDDCDEGSDGQWERVTSWIGILKTDADSSPWDEDLYGENRWPMPYTHGA